MTLRQYSHAFSIIAFLALLANFPPEEAALDAPSPPKLGNPLPPTSRGLLAPPPAGPVGSCPWLGLVVVASNQARRLEKVCMLRSWS